MSDTNKRRPKGDIKFQVSLNEEQKEAKSLILKSKISVLKGTAGSGKSMLAAQVALDLLFRHEVEKIILTRPAVTSGEDIGFLPGDKDAKLAPYTAAIYDNMYRLYRKDLIDKHLMEGNIEVIPLAFMRGRNLTNCCVVVDEGQNITHRQMELLLGRLCNGSRMIICGDTAQIDLKDKKQSTLKTNHRDPIVEDILKVYSDHRD